MALAMVAPARGGPAAGAVPAPDRRVLSVPGRGACGLRPHPPAAGEEPGQRCSLSTGCTGSPRRPRPSPQPGAACRGPRRPCAQVSDTGTSGGSVHLRDGRGCGSGFPPPPPPLLLLTVPSDATPGFSGGTCCPPRLQSLVARDVDPVSDSSPALCLFPSATWGRGWDLCHRSGGLPASRAEATCSDGGAASELMTTRRQTSKRFSIFLPILPSGSR